MTDPDRLTLDGDRVLLKALPVRRRKTDDDG